LSKQLQPNTLEILRNRYFLRDGQGEAVEDFEGLCRRVAHYVAQAEPDNPPGHQATIEEAFFQAMYNQEFMPNSPALFNAGTAHPMLSACFILPVGDSIREIYESVADGAVIEKLGGGIGMDFSQIRPSGSLTSAGGMASGPISFMTTFQAMSDTIKQGGKRRGAMMAMLQVDHPEILSFIECKLKTPPERARFLSARYGLPDTFSRRILRDLDWQAPFNGFNITVKLTDEFMDAVRDDQAYPLRDPRGGYWTGPVTDPRSELRVTQSGGAAPAALPAQRVWQRIVEAAWRSGEPGIAFIDRINADNPVSSLGPIRSSNPCGEYWQVDYNSCNLGSINVSRFLGDGQNPDLAWQQKIDWNRLANVARTAARFLDGVISVSEYPVGKIQEVTLKSRPVGLGVMGFADLLLKLGIRYGSPESVTVAERIMQWIQYWAWVESAHLAKRFTPFPELDRNRDYFAPKMERLTEKFIEAFSRPDFSHLSQLVSPLSLERLYKQSGVRNCHVTVQAPTGSISLIAECSSGIEPVFAFEYTRQDSIGVRTYRHPELETWQKAHPDQALPDFFVDASRVKPEEHILIQAAFQKHVDNAVSKTANLPPGATPQDVEEIYRLAYEKGLKSVTVYMEGSREGVLLRNSSEPALIETRAVEREPAVVPPGAGYVTRPEFLQGLTRKIRTPFGTVYVTVNFDSRLKQITEVFVRESSGNEAWELVGRLLSLLLRSGVALDKVLSQLYRTRGQNTIVLDEKILSSVAQAIARTIERADKFFRGQDETSSGALEAPADGSSSAAQVPHLSSAALARVCPECGRETLFPAGGCLTCTNCGFSTCGGTVR
jgi:ribonucleoside-diphosphate reductase alpha chain